MIALLFIPLLPLTEGHRATKTAESAEERTPALEGCWPCSEAVVLLQGGGRCKTPSPQKSSGGVPEKCANEEADYTNNNKNKIKKKEGWGDAPHADGQD